MQQALAFMEYVLSPAGQAILASRLPCGWFIRRCSRCLLRCRCCIEPERWSDRMGMSFIKGHAQVKARGRARTQRDGLGLFCSVPTAC